MIIVYSLVNIQPLTYNSYVFPESVYSKTIFCSRKSDLSIFIYFAKVLAGACQH